ncbi:D-alanyl-D-alanine carboxypeptidase [Eudoraea sp.]|uniref:D-alanyl-D-alanine carboxypeptidase n=1 Tax=Eudoraea sp. TaxID=1979955 RepID=UPI003C75D758
MDNYKTSYLLILFLLLLGACVSTKKIHKKVNKTFPFSSDNHFTGIMVYDPELKDTIVQYNSSKYFTPASNVKIFTLYTALKLLADEVPALKYFISNDTTYIEGTGDPSFLHPKFKDSTAYNFIKASKYIALNLDNFYEETFGPGWAWEDYDFSFAPERNALPLYGNVICLTNNEDARVYPKYFETNIEFNSKGRYRDRNENKFYIDSLGKDTLYIPYITKDSVILALLKDELKKEIILKSPFPKGTKKTLLGMSRDSLAKEMMQQSDNFIAEQFLILGSSTISDSLSSKKTIDYMLENYLMDLNQMPRWVDGSGLSRYNLFSPASIVHVLNAMYSEYPKERLLNIFAVGGESGTIKEWYNGNPTPYIYAKTGTLGNNHCLSGYLKTDSGKTLIFSIMNNHFKQPVSEIKLRMQELLAYIKVNY